MSDKKRYKGVFNWYGEIYTMWTHTYSLSQARTTMLSNLAKKLGLTYKRASDYFLPERDNYKIEEDRNEQ